MRVSLRENKIWYNGDDLEGSSNVETVRVNWLKTEMGKKQLYGYFKQQIVVIALLTWLKEGNQERETESFSVAEQKCLQDQLY